VQDLVLGTEMVRHKDVMKHFNARFSSDAPLRHLWTGDDRKALMVSLLHAADLSAPSRPPDLGGTWAHAVCNEFFKQAEMEAELGLALAAPSPNRQDSVIWKSQVRRVL
jgi:calcium/calmodulin-dependent 3',5'-cyclic nucleotide phosphodiesterase